MPFRRPRAQRTPRQPKAPKPQLPSKPKTSDLRAILKGYITADVTSRLNTLAYALQWYDGALQYCVARRKVGPDLTKTLDRAVNARKQGLGTNILPEKEQAHRTSVLLYEKVCGFLHPPSAKAVFDKYFQKKDLFEKKQESIGEKFGDFVELITKALQPKNPEGNALQIIVTDAQKPFGFDPTITQVSYDRAEARRVKDKIRREGLLPAAIDEAARLARGAAYEPAPDGSGKYMVNAKKMLEAYHAILQNFVTYASTDPAAPKRLAKRPVAVQVVAGQSVPSTTSRPKVARTPGASKGPKVLGLYIQGGAMAIVGQYLADHNQQWFEQAELQKLVAAEVAGRLKAMQKHGIQYGMWSIEQKGTTWRMVLNTAPVSQQPASQATSATP